MPMESPKEHFWREHKDSLQRIRTDLLSGRKSAGKARTPVYGKRSPAGKPGHPPYGRYRRATPPNLPRLDTPPEHDERRSRRNLRRDRFEEVPPVKPRQAFVKPPEYDSWGEEESADDDDELKPHPLPYPIYAPPNVVYGQPFPMYYPPPPKGAMHRQKHRNKKRKSERGYREIHKDRYRSLSKSEKHQTAKSGRRHRRSREKARHSIPHGYPVPMHSYPGPVNGFPMAPVPMLNAYVMPVHTVHDGSQSESEDDSEEEEVKPRYISPRKTYQYIKPLLDTSDAHDDTYTYFIQNPLFAEDFVSWLITDCLEEEIVPDVLIDAMTDLDKLPSEHPYFLPALKSCDDFLTREIEQMSAEIARETIGEMTNRQGNPSATPHYVPPRQTADVYFDMLLESTVSDVCREIVGETIRGLAHQHLDDVTAENILDDLVTEEINDMRDELLEDAIFDAIAEDFIHDQVVFPEVEEEATVIAKDMIKHYDNKITRRELKAVKDKSGDRLIDSMCLDYLLRLIARQGKVWTESDYANKFMDELMGNILLQQYFAVKTTRDKTLNCKPLRKLHEKAVTDVALDVILQHLSASLDEDLADVDEYERGVNDGVPQIQQYIPTVIR